MMVWVCVVRGWQCSAEEMFELWGTGAGLIGWERLCRETVRHIN